MNRTIGLQKSSLAAASFAISLLFSVWTHAGQSPLTGLVINQTGSYQAQNFYQAFCLVWHEQPSARQFNVVLKEVHSPRHGRQVHILFDHQVAYVAAIPSGHMALDAMAEQAASQAISRIRGMALQKATYRHPDLARDEI